MWWLFNTEVQQMWMSNKTDAINPEMDENELFDELSEGKGPVSVTVAYGISWILDNDGGWVGVAVIEGRVGSWVVVV